MLSFWVRRDGQEEWQPVPAEGAILEEDTYTILARCPQPYFTITVEVHYRPLTAEDEGAPAEAKASKRATSLLQTRSVRTNEEGISLILPATHLSPGFWELHCRDADLIAELFGETELNNCLRFQVVPAPAQSEPAAPSVVQPTEPEASTQTQEAAVPPELFSLLHSDLEGSPQEVLVLTGRIGCSGELQVQLWQEGNQDPLFQGRRQIQLPGQARAAVFSLPLTLPSQPWARPLRGELRLTPSSGQASEPLTIPFSIRCRSQESLASETPLPQQHQEEDRLTDVATPASTTTLLSPERTLQKLLRIWQGSPPAPRPAQPGELPADTVPPAEAQAEAEAVPPSSLPPSPSPELPSEEAVLPVPPALPLPVTEQNPEALPLGVCPAPQLLVPEQLRAGDNFDVVLRLPASVNSASGSTSQPPLWIKFWVKHGRTRSLVDGPRWLLDFSRDDQGRWQALTRMTIPPGVPELIFEAWAVSPDRQQQSDRVTERRSILP
ncbi:hypothetical protein [Synechococcus sp. H70.2]|uniref:hypothetical protein n=1 Tax=Synechococcus sp. H70.2 TaxID=2964528 RepID=UPI0039C294E0